MMGYGLWDAEDLSAEPLFLKSHSWATIVEAIRRLDVLPQERVDLLLDMWNPEAKLTAPEARDIAKLLRLKVLSGLQENEFLHWDGSADFSTAMRYPGAKWPKNGYVSGKILAEFCDLCERSNGIAVRE